MTDSWKTESAAITNREAEAKQETVFSGKSARELDMATDIVLRPRHRRWLPVVLALLLAGVAYGAGFATAVVALGGSGSTRQDGVFEQTGNFQSVAGQGGVVNFPVPYQFPPNVELETGSRFNKTVITECNAHRFMWRNSGNDDVFNNAPVTWKARGVK